MASSKKVTRKARKGAASKSASTIAIEAGKPLSDEMAKAEKAVRAALRKPATVQAVRKAAGIGLHSVRALLVRVRAKPGDERGTYRL